MVAQVIELGCLARRERIASPAVSRRRADSDESARHEFQFWTGTSGRPYVHTVYSLLWCPELPASNYVLVRRDGNGRRQILKIDSVEHAAPSLNLAELRQQGATLGANEVHVHFLAGSHRQRRAIAADLQAGVAPPESLRLSRG